MPARSKQQSAFQKQFHSTRKRTQQHIADYKSRRPHRSFRLTRRRDYVRGLALPGYWSFSGEVQRTLWSQKKTFLGLAVVYGLLSVVFIGMGSQDTYASLVSTLQETGGQVFQGNWAELGQAGLLFLSVATSGLTGALTPEQQIYSTLLILLVWLTTIWLLRYHLAGHRVKLRDGLYSAGAPLVPTFLLGLVFVVQLLPLALGLMAYSAAQTSGLLAGGIEAMLAWMAIILAAVISFYWVVSTFFAMIVVTAPGTYPMQALKTAGDMVIGRRMRLLLRLVWAAFLIILAWAVVLIPVIILDGWLKSWWPAIEWLPIVPIVLLILSVISVIWSTAYIYLLYRKVLEDGSAPA